MQHELQVTWHGLYHSEAIETQIRQRAAALEKFYPNITSCRVAVELPHRHKHQGKLFNVRIDLRVPHGEVIVNRDQHEDIHVALRDAFDAARRQIEDVLRRQRGDVKVHAEPLRGTVARLLPEEGYGFIETADGDELYVSRDNVVTPEFDQLRGGTTVQFIREDAAEGPQAKRVSVGKHHGAG
jgi:cold shock CspA family protein/ribosome-associated translation inhibitor RaiA